MSFLIDPLRSPLLTDEQSALLDSLLPYTADTALKAASALRKAGLDASDTARLLSQAKLRTKAQAKFGEQALTMFFTEAGYEQSTRAAVAALHAQRFVDAGLSSVADLGCGIGADSLAFAQGGLDVTAVELDADTATFTAHNLAPFEKARVLCADIISLDLSQLTDTQGQPVQALWLDPARREVEGGRTAKRVWDAEAFSPPLSFVEQLAATGIPMGVKMGPSIPHNELPANCEAQWVTHAGSVVEVVLWFNALARPGVRRAATVLDNHPLVPHVLGELVSPAESGSEEVEVLPLAEYIYEPDGAVIRAGLVADMAQGLKAHFLDENIAYLSSSRLCSNQLASGYKVLEVLPLHEKHLKKWVKEQRITALTIKKRGVDIVPETLRAKLLAGTKKKKGHNSPAILIATRIGSGSDSQRFALHVEPLGPAS